MKINTLIPIILILFLAGCATPAYKEVFLDKTANNAKEFSVPSEELYQATVRALCTKNFIIENEDKEKGFILGKRAFPRGKRNIVLLIQGKIVALEQNSSTLYLNAIETTEISYVSDHTRFFMFIVPLPGGGGKQATTIKEKEKTIQDKKFYNEFFKLIQEIILAGSKKEKTKESKIKIEETAKTEPQKPVNATEEISSTKQQEDLNLTLPSPK
jgi:hypothetical protein